MRLPRPIGQPYGKSILPIIPICLKNLLKVHRVISYL